MKKNVELSRWLGNHKKVKAIPKMCYRNASRIVQHVPGYEDAAYVEGIAVLDSGMLIEHGWVEFQGQIIDPTLPEVEIAYFPGLRFEGQRGLAEAQRMPKHFKGDPDVPIFYRFGWGGGDSKDFCQAWNDAWEYLASIGKCDKKPCHRS